MKELFNVDFHCSGSFTLNLKNGKINVPEEQGCYAISTGCGSGKTECAKSIIRQRYKDGILYCVDTITELDKMYRWILDNKDQIGISAEDVTIISSDDKHHEQTRDYRNNPETLMSKQIVLITHHRFWTDPINYFLIYNPKTADCGFDGDFKELLARPDLRKYVIFDETPLFITPFFSMPHSLLGIFSDKVNGQWQCKSRDQIEEYYCRFLQGSELDPFGNTDSKLKRVKRDMVFNMIPQYFSRWIAGNEAYIKFAPICLCQAVVRTHILIMEGAGNVLFHGSKHFKLLDVPDKYNCKVKFERYDFDIIRRKQLNDKAFTDHIKWLTKRLRSNQKAGKKTLVVVWMNQGKDTSDKDHGYYDKVVSKIGSKRLNKDSYRIIYYGSSESKSTNEFRDYSEVILCGVWNIVNTETFRFNEHYGVAIQNSYHKLWAYIQLLCRIGIRMHDGGEFTVCYSSDFSQQWISQLQAYFENKPLTLPTGIDADACPEWLSMKMDAVGLGKGRKAEIIKVCEWLGDRILVPLQQNLAVKINVALDDLHTLIHRSRKKPSEYKGLANGLSKLGITLEIIGKSKRAVKNAAD